MKDVNTNFFLSPFPTQLWLGSLYLKKRIKFSLVRHFLCLSKIKLLVFNYKVVYSGNTLGHLLNSANITNLGVGPLVLSNSKCNNKKNIFLKEVLIWSIHRWKTKPTNRTTRWQSFLVVVTISGIFFCLGVHWLFCLHGEIIECIKEWEWRQTIVMWYCLPEYTSSNIFWSKKAPREVIIKTGHSVFVSFVWALTLAPCAAYLCNLTVHSGTTEIFSLDPR